jgi:uridine phosphorylase
MQNQPYPVLEFDPALDAFINPGYSRNHVAVAGRGVVCFFQDVIDELVQRGVAEQVDTEHSEIGAHPIYEFTHQGNRLTMFHPGVGAPLAAGLLEEVIARDCRKFIACGGAGALVPELALGHIVVPTAAVRDEGTSYHYLPPSREVAASPEAVAAIEQTLIERGFSYVKAKTWTTDAIYRETAARIIARRAEGCVTVEMEAAAFFAVAQFRGICFGQMLYSGDDLSGAAWDSRHWTRHEIRETLFWLAADACLKL